METVGLGFCFEDLRVGRQFKTIGRTVTEADITNFVNCTGMVEILAHSALDVGFTAGTPVRRHGHGE